MATPRQPSDLEKARLFLRALNSFTMAEAALRHRDKLQPPFRSLADHLLSSWERTENQARNASTEEATAILLEFTAGLDERMLQGEKDITERSDSGQRTGPLFLAWGIFYLFKIRAQDLEEDLAPPVSASVTEEKDSKQVLPSTENHPDMAALHDFQMALGLGP